jgi:hypothetical protein
MKNRATKRKNALNNSILKFPTVSSMSSDSIVKGIIDDIIKTAVKTAEVDEQKRKRKHEKVISQLYKVNTEQNINNILLINMTQSCQIKHFTCILRLLNNTCVKHNFKSVHVSDLFCSREYNSATEICKYASFSKVGGNYRLDLKIIWSSEHDSIFCLVFLYCGQI